MAKYGNKPVVVNGVKYKSTLEGKAATLLSEAGLNFKYEPVTFTFQEGFKGDNISIEEGKLCSLANRAITYTPDFVGDIWIMETKGMITPDFSIKWKMFKKELEKLELEHILFLPRNKKQIMESIGFIKKVRIMQEAFAIVDGRIAVVNKMIADGLISAEPFQIKYAKIGEKAALITKWLKEDEKKHEDYESIIIERFNLQRLHEVEELIPSPEIEIIKPTKIKYTE